MKLILHIVGKDLRRWRWPLAARLLVIALKLAIGFSLILTDRMSYPYGYDVLGAFANDLLGLELLLTFLLTAMLVQDDALVGTTPFWLTRPLSGWRLLGAKVAGWVLLLWLPAVGLTLPWWLACAFGPREVALAVLEMLLLYGAVSVLAAVVAVLTDTLGRFLMWSFVLVFALAVVPGTLIEWLTSPRKGDPLPVAEVAIYATCLPIFAVVIARQFLKRGFMRSAVWYVAGVAMAPVAALTFPAVWGPLTHPERRGSDWRPERAKGIALVPARVVVQAEPKPVDGIWLSTHFNVQGVPNGLFVDSGEVAQETWRWPGGPVVTREAWTTGTTGRANGIRNAIEIPAPQPDDETKRFWAGQQTRRAPNPGRTRFLSRVIGPNSAIGVDVTAEVFPSTLQRMRQAAPAFDASVALRMIHPEIRVEVPLESSGWLARAAHGFRIGRPVLVTWATRPDEGETVLVPKQFPVLGTRLESIWESPSLRMANDEWRGAGLYVMNRADGDLEPLQVTNSNSLTIASVRIDRTMFQPWQARVRRGGKWVLRDEHWLDGATVAMVGFSEEARFKAEVKEDSYEVPQ